MTIRTDVLDRIEADALARVSAPAPAPVPGASRRRDRKHRVARSAMATLALATTLTAGEIALAPEPAAASCSDWLSPNYTTQNHSKACGLSIRFYTYTGTTQSTAYPYHTTCRKFSVRQFTCGDYYNAGTAQACRTIRIA